MEQILLQMRQRFVMSLFNAARTIAEPFTVEGLGLHCNRPCSVTVSPAEAGGLRFLHSASGTVIPASAEHVADGLSLATTLSKDGARLQTVEHLLAALSGLGVDHALVSCDGDELPILDGSAGPWVRAIGGAGLVDLPTPKACIRVLDEVRVDRGGRHIRVLPHEGPGAKGGLTVAYTIDFPCPSIGRQSFELAVTPDRFRRELADARTFCMKSDIEAMQARGLALGGSLENALVYDETGCLNGPLRFPDEAVRHKMMDLVGDLAVLGATLVGRVEAFAAGHAMHVELAKALLASPGAWTMEPAPEAGHRVFHVDFARLAAV
jgi:UDP-3-O-[3-hydroxymyristoyl] N-acetylglucosamine deacetylase